MNKQLSPTQQSIFSKFLADQSLGSFFVVNGYIGMGKSTLLRQIHATLGGAWLEMKEFVGAMRTHHPLALEECFEDWLMTHLKANESVILDDFDLLSNVVQGCHAYPRSGFLNVPLISIVEYVEKTGKKLILSGYHHFPHSIQQRSFDYPLRQLQPNDYEFICSAYLGTRLASGLDFNKIHRFAPMLNGHQLKWSSVCRSHDESLDTETFIEFLRTHHMISNVDLEEVQQVTLRDLMGIDEVIQSLEANIIIPLENDQLAAELKLKPKRGVLLLGPPGTGKTTVGRALAHRLKSKFFLLDGTVISGTQDFYWQIQNLFHQAKQNAPAIIFIDDSDVIFEDKKDLGLYRYLLTMLDGLESESFGRVCVMMTAMNVGHLPPALIRSGRIELWLEMKLPDATARAAILKPRLQTIPYALQDGLDLEALVTVTEGFTGADLKRLVEDGKNRLAYDKVQNRPLESLTHYLLAAVSALRADKKRWEDSEGSCQGPLLD